MSIRTPIQILPIGYYSNLLTSEYRNSTQFNKWLGVVLNIANDISNCLASITSAFDLDTAIGAQLDTLGLIITGNPAARIVPFQPTNGVSPVLDDTTFRLLLKATIANNTWDGKISSLYGIWSNLFPGGQITIIDNQNMTADIILTGNFTSIISDLIVNGLIVPRPQAVAYTYLFGDLPLFGFGPNTQYVAGFGLGHWS
jgi:hypothetical protein